jgi:flagellar motor switch protein FliG
VSDVDDAQLEIVNAAKQLAEQGEILLSDGGEEDELVY